MVNRKNVIICCATLNSCAGIDRERYMKLKRSGGVDETLIATSDTLAIYKRRTIDDSVASMLVCWSLTSLRHSNGHIETMPAREINSFTALPRIRSQFLRTQWSTSNHQRADTTTPHTAQPSGLATQLRRILITQQILHHCATVPLQD